MNTSEFTGMVASLLPCSGENTHAKAARMLMHTITLTYCFDKVPVETVRYANGNSFMKYIVRNKPLVDKLAQAVSVVVPMPYPGSSEAPEDLTNLAKKHHICVEALKTSRKKPYDIFYELHTVVTYMQVVDKILDRLKSTDLQMLERGYRGHCHPTYIKPKRSLRSFFLKSDINSYLVGLPASELPGARPRTEIVSEPAKFPVHPRLRTTSQSSQSTSRTTSTRSQYRSRATSNASLSSQYRSVSRKSSAASFHSAHHVPMPYAVPPVPVLVYTCQNITYETRQRQVVEQVHVPAVSSQPVRRT
ncbi:hypothetical protein RhiJN_27785 [Ceratobasidium sp. AG-Ba]|nr:hypothetical protein RhiJN_27785 [Ceratobasidium sp. AG-Ba]